MKNSNSIFKKITTIPLKFYAGILIFLPLLYIFILSFFRNDYYGGIIPDFTFDNYRMLIDVVYLKVFLQSFLIAFITTFICICISYPFCLIIRTKKETTQKLIMTFVMIPFLTNSLIRTYGWIVLLRKNGVINQFLMGTHLISSPLSLMYNYFGIVIGMVYTLLPFMILPLNSAVSKLDDSLLDASKDLGANRLQTFFKVVVPETLPGLFNGSLMVFIPAIGLFFISDILGGGKLMLLGNLIKNQFLTARNWPFGAAISITLIIITFIFVKLYKKIGGKMDDLGGGL